jgi:site-specific recombinase XerD
MISDLRLAGYSEATIGSYVGVVAQLARYWKRPPDRIGDEDVRRYLLHLIEERKVSRQTLSVYLCGLRAFYGKTLKRELGTLDLVRPAARRRLPVVLAREEVWRILDRVRCDVYRICLTTIYSCGLRVSEGAHLEVGDIDGARHLLRVREGKGGRDRLIPLPQATLELLRALWRSHRSCPWLFPSPAFAPETPENRHAR